MKALSTRVLVTSLLALAVAGSALAQRVCAPCCNNRSAVAATQPAVAKPNTAATPLACPALTEGACPPCCNNRSAVANTQPAVAKPSAAAAPLAVPATAPAIMPGRGMGQGGMGRGNAGVMSYIHALLSNHDKIARSVKEIPGGVETTTTSDDPATEKLIRTHVVQMKTRLEAGQPIRMWDPLFVELFHNYKAIKMEVVEIPGGVRVTETSDDPQATLLIRQHAIKGVSEFVAKGWDRVHQPTTLPSGYEKSK